MIVDLACGWQKYPESIGLDVCNYNNDIVADVLHTPFCGSIADLVVMRQIIEHVYPEGLIREAWRILKPNGKILLETPNCLEIFIVLRALHRQEASPHLEHIQTFSSAELRNLLTRNGFVNLTFSYKRIVVGGSNSFLRFLKSVIAFWVDKLFPMFNRDIRVVAAKDSEAKFAVYRK